MATSGAITNPTGTNLAYTNGNFTNVTTGNLTTTGITNLATTSVTSLVANAITSALASITDLLFGNATGTNITATGTADLANIVNNTLTSNTATITNLTGTNANLTNATITNLSVTNLVCNIGRNFFCDEGNTRGKNLTLGTNDNFAQIFETNNTERMRITEAGNVGVGTMAPTQKLQVFGNILSAGGVIQATGNNLINIPRHFVSRFHLGKFENLRFSRYAPQVS